MQPELLAVAIAEDFQNRPARILLASRTEAGRISSAELAFDGTIQNIRIQEGPDNPTLEIIMRSIYADLEIAGEVRYSAADEAEIDPQDSFFAFLEASREGEPIIGG